MSIFERFKKPAVRASLPEPLTPFSLQVKAVLIDIEGTMVSSRFIEEVLDPYIRRHLKSHLETYWDLRSIQEIVATLIAMPEYANFRKDIMPDAPSPRNSRRANNDKANVGKTLEAINNYVLYLMDMNNDSTPVKELQGRICRLGYENRTLKVVLFSDVAENMSYWFSSGLQLAVISRGSKQAQQLFLERTNFGNITDMIETYFDTTRGSKLDPATYDIVARTMGVRHEDILFITDYPSEAVVAYNAGFQAVIIERPGNLPIPDKYAEHFQIINSFEELDLRFRRKPRLTK